MKTSNILLLTYFGLLLAGILALFIISKNGEDQNVLAYQKNFVSKQMDLPDFSVVVLQDSAKCKLIVADSNNVTWQLPKKSTAKTMPLFVRNDTLYVQKSYTGNTWDMLIQCKTLKEVITTQGCCVRIVDPNLKNLRLIGNGGEIFVENEHPEINNKIVENLVLDVRATSQTSITISVPMKKLTTTLSHASIDVKQVYTKTQAMVLTLKDTASAQIYGCPSNITLVKDTTSWYRVQ